jgi:hypothetical protein
MAKTMRKLLSSGMSDKQILNYLRGLHTGVKYDHLLGINGSIWTIGSTEPTLEWVKNVRKDMDLIDKLSEFSFFKESWLDRELCQHRNPWKNNITCELFKAIAAGGGL